MKSLPFTFPTAGRLGELVTLHRSGDNLAPRFAAAVEEGRCEEAFELLLALRIAQAWPNPVAVRVLLYQLDDWEAFALALLSLGPEASAALVELLEAKALDPFRVALGLYLVTRLLPPVLLPPPLAKAIEDNDPQATEPAVRACFQLIENVAPEAEPAPLRVLKAFVDRALSLPIERWMGGHTPAPASRVLRKPGAP